MFLMCPLLPSGRRGRQQNLMRVGSCLKVKCRDAPEATLLKYVVQILALLVPFNVDTYARFMYLRVRCI